MLKDVAALKIFNNSAYSPNSAAYRVAGPLQNQLSGIAPPSISKPSFGGTIPAIASPQPTAAQVPSTLSKLIDVTEQLSNIPSATTNNNINQLTQSVNAVGQIPWVGSVTSQQRILSAANVTTAQLEAPVKAAATDAPSNANSRGDIKSRLNLALNLAEWVCIHLHTWVFPCLLLLSLMYAVIVYIEWKKCTDSHRLLNSNYTYRTPANLLQLVLNLAQLPCMMDHTFPSSPTSRILHFTGGPVIDAITDLCC